MSSRNKSQERVGVPTHAVLPRTGGTQYSINTDRHGGRSKGGNVHKSKERQSRRPSIEQPRVSHQQQQQQHHHNRGKGVGDSVRTTRRRSSSGSSTQTRALSTGVERDGGQGNTQGVNSPMAHRPKSNSHDHGVNHTQPRVLRRTASSTTVRLLSSTLNASGPLASHPATSSPRLHTPRHAGSTLSDSRPHTAAPTHSSPLVNMSPKGNHPRFFSSTLLGEDAPASRTVTAWRHDPMASRQTRHGSPRAMSGSTNGEGGFGHGSPASTPTTHSTASFPGNLTADTSPRRTVPTRPSTGLPSPRRSRRASMERAHVEGGSAGRSPRHNRATTTTPRHTLKRSASDLNHRVSAKSKPVTQVPPVLSARTPADGVGGDGATHTPPTVIDAHKTPLLSFASTSIPPPKQRLQRRRSSQSSSGGGGGGGMGGHTRVRAGSSSSSHGAAVAAIAVNHAASGVSTTRSIGGRSGSVSAHTFVEDAGLTASNSSVTDGESPVSIVRQPFGRRPSDPRRRSGGSGSGGSGSGGEGIVPDRTEFVTTRTGIKMPALRLQPILLARERRNDCTHTLQPLAGGDSSGSVSGGLHSAERTNRSAASGRAQGGGGGVSQHHLHNMADETVWHSGSGNPDGGDCDDASDNLSHRGVRLRCETPGCGSPSYLIQANSFCTACNFRLRRLTSARKDGGGGGTSEVIVGHETHRTTSTGRQTYRSFAPSTVRFGEEAHGDWEGDATTPAASAAGVPLSGTTTSRSSHVSRSSVVPGGDASRSGRDGSGRGGAGGRSPSLAEAVVAELAVANELQQLEDPDPRVRLGSDAAEELGEVLLARQLAATRAVERRMDAVNEAAASAAHHTHANDTNTVRRCKTASCTSPTYLLQRNGYCTWCNRARRKAGDSGTSVAGQAPLSPTPQGGSSSAAGVHVATSLDEHGNHDDDDDDDGASWSSGSDTADDGTGDRVLSVDVYSDTDLDTVSTGSLSSYSVSDGNATTNTPPSGSPTS